MHYSYEFKLMCVELYKSGKYPDIPDGVNSNRFKKNIRDWSRMVDSFGPEVLKHKTYNKVWKPEEKLALVSRVIAGSPRTTVAIEAGISAGMLYRWVQKYKAQGYNGLINKKSGPQPKDQTMKKPNANTPIPLTESEREELIRLRAENEYIKAENEVIKKQIALRHEKWAAELKAKKQQSSKNLGKKDIN